jgi:transcriptional regulator with XRE-family HTH domain
MSASVHERFATNLRRLRAEARISQEELAFRASVHRTQISLMEDGKRLPRFETVVKLAGALEVPPNAFYEGIKWQPMIATFGGMVVKTLTEERTEGKE